MCFKSSNKTARLSMMQQAEEGEKARALSRMLASTGPATPTRADEERRGAVIEALNKIRQQEGRSAAYLTSGGGAGDPEYA